MPPPTAARSGPGPSAALLPCRSKAQELWAGLSSNTLRFVTIGRAKGLIAFRSDRAGPVARWGSAQVAPKFYFLINWWIKGIKTALLCCLLFTINNYLIS